MLRALVWKEWRQQQPLVLAALGIAAIIPFFLMAGTLIAAPQRGGADVVDMLPMTLAMFIWPIFAAFAGATTIAADSADGSLRFLLSRPVSRARVWFVKVALGAAAFVAVVLGTVFITLLLTFLTNSTRARLTREMLADVFDPRALIGAGVPFALLFACCVYCSAFFKRPMAAALAGFAISVVMGLLVSTAWMAFLLPGGLPRLDAVFIDTGFVVGIPLSALGMLGTALWVFARNEEIGTRARQRMWLPLLVVTLVVILIGAVPATFAMISEMASVQVGMQADTRMVDGNVVLPERADGGMSTRIVVVAADGGERRTLVSRHAMLPLLSPDGSWLTYASFDGYISSLRGDFELRAVRTDGSNDHAISGTTTWDWGFLTDALFDPGSQRVAYFNRSGVTVASVVEDASIHFEIPLAASPYGGIIGWSATVANELLYFHMERWGTEDDMATTELRALDVATGDERVIRTLDGEHPMRIRGSGGRFVTAQPLFGWEFVPVWIGDDNGVALHLIDTATGNMQQITEDPCGYWGFSANGSGFLYGVCTGSTRTAVARGEFRTRNLETGTDEPFAVVEGLRASGLARRVHRSPDGEWLLIYAWRRVGGWSTIGISRSGEVRDLAVGLWPVGWIDNSSVLVGGGLRQRISGGRALSRWQLNVVDLDSRSNRIIYP